MDEIRRIVRDIEKLSKLERLLLYMELPSSLSTLSDPLRQPLNPLGSRFEIQLTITWIKTHLEEDQQVSLPKHEVYDDYLEYCNFNSLKPLSTADFGKVMKQVYPQVRPRRLGTRGNSRYCYAGLKKRLKLEEPVTPECGGTGGKLMKVNNVDCEQEMNEASSFLIREWAGKLLTAKFGNLRELALFLIDKMFVDNRSSAAHTVISSMSKQTDDVEMKHKPDGILVNGSNPAGVAQGVYDHKRKIDLPVNSSELAVSNVKRPNLKRSKYGLSEAPYSNVGVKSPLNNEIDAHEKQHPAVSVAMVEDNPPQQYPQFAIPNEDPTHGFYESNSNGNGPPSSEVNQSKLETSSVSAANLECIKPWDLEPNQVVQPNLEIKEPIDEELDTLFKDNPMSGHDNENQQKLSQLRHMLEKNLKSPSLAYSTNGGQQVTSEAVLTSTQPPLSTRRRVSFIVQDPVNQQPGHISGGGGPTPNNPGVGVQNGPSPGTRKRHFSFQPISPRQASLPQSPSASPFISPRSTPVHMMRSRHSSGSALPLHMLPQGNSKNNPYGSAGSDISRAATFGSASECSTPFISPHGTPIPFNRSRHNSAQGRLCRSRHSSGVAVGPYRYTMTPCSPMAFSNLNNPYSPQPATPAGSTSGEDVFNMSHNAYMGDGMVSAVSNVEDVTNQQVVLDQRSRHNSAESDPSLVKSAPMSPASVMNQNNSYVEIGGQRLRHQSAGNPPNPALATLKPPDWIQDPTLTFATSDDLQDSMFDHRRSQSVPIGELPNSSGMDYLPTSFLETEGHQNSSSRKTTIDVMMTSSSGASEVVTSTNSASTNSNHGGANANANPGSNDDLDLTLSALKDCDKDFSKFVQEVENNGTK